MVSNKEIAKVIKSAASLMEVHGANAFKTRAYSSAVFNIEKSEEALGGKSSDELQELGFSKSMAEKIVEISGTGSFADFDKLLEETPEGVVKMLEIKGIGGKKIATIWKELEIETIEALEKACRENKVQALKGFGAKTEQTILEQIQFLEENKGKLYYAEAEPLAQSFVEYLQQAGFSLVEASGEVRRKMEIVETLQWVVATDDFSKLKNELVNIPDWEYHEKDSGPNVWRGEITDLGMPVEVKIAKEQDFAKTLLLNSCDGKHLSLVGEKGKILSEIVRTTSQSSEEAYYEVAGLPFFPPEMRDGFFERELLQNGGVPELVKMEDLKGILHNHSTYSDGKHTLEEMARHCKELGYDYLGITDHSKSAFYANGLNEDRIRQQHAEIDELNKQLAPFKIFKGIESDILNDGSLDYSDDVLASFDFIIASIHSNLKMDKKKATDRLLKAIANPYTTMLGHPTGRLLLKREGYPIDHKMVIDACAEHNVMIEINAHPWRLDLDWRWVRYALSKGVMISVNPDAHEMEGYQYMRFGLLVGRKAGLTKEMTLNAMSTEEVAKRFAEKNNKQ
ncbi:DNA polymerase/3'-5' exonuclease PolX [Limibacter armeniacum]|uniref:DNA polymerase/3'-5' exonuclease PolX n=1 Tax=Limibacter armeniacum TaxID=466084 RepID=UPI002FE543D1